MHRAFLRRHPRKFAFLLVLGIAACALWLSARQHLPDPSYNGRQLSEWLWLIGHSNGVNSLPAQRKEATEAIQQIGSNAVPTLLAWLAYEPPISRYHLMRASQRLPRSVLSSRPVQRLLCDARADEQAQNAVEALACLGPMAAPAILELSRRASVPYSLSPSSKRSRAMLALAKLGAPALPAIAAQLSSPGGAGDLWVMACVETLGTNARPLVPILIKNLNHTDWFAAMINIRLLGELKFDPDIVVPALTRCLQDPRREVRMEAPRALMRFGELASQSLPVLTSALGDPDPDVRTNAARAIAVIARDKPANAPAPHAN